MTLRSLSALACLMLAGCETVSSARTDGVYGITVRSQPFDQWPSESLLIGEAAGLCPTGYQRLGEVDGDNPTFGAHPLQRRRSCHGECAIEGEGPRQATPRFVSSGPVRHPE